MEEISSFAVRPVDGGLPRVELICDGKPTGTLIDGVSLEKQFSVAAGYLIGRDAHIRDHLELGAPLRIGDSKECSQ